MGIGSLISQIIGLVGVIFIARLFGPTKYGIYTTVLAFVTFFHLFIFGGLSKAVVREGSKKVNPFSQVLTSAIGVRILFIFLAVAFCIVGTFFTNYSKMLKIFIIIYSFEIFYYGIDSFLSAIYQTTENMQYLAYFSVSMRFFVTVLSILFLYLGAGVLEILLVNLFSRFAVVMVNFFNSRRLVKFKINISINLASPLLKATFIFSLITFINTLAVKIDILMISFLSTSTDVGIYAIAHEIAREGLILRNIIATAFFPIAVKFISSKEVRIQTLLTYSGILFFVILAGCLLLSYFAQDIVVYVFGVEYHQSGKILKYLIFYLSFAFLSLPLTTYLQASHNEHLLLIVYSVTALTNIPLNIILFYQYGLIGIAYSTLIVFLVQASLITLLTIRKLKHQESSA
jgi:O-antigen/teichoic acid export membrane protein